MTSPVFQRVSRTRSHYYDGDKAYRGVAIGHRDSVRESEMHIEMKKAGIDFLAWLGHTPDDIYVEVPTARRLPTGYVDVMAFDGEAPVRAVEVETGLGPGGFSNTGASIAARAGLPVWVAYPDDVFWYLPTPVDTGFGEFIEVELFPAETPGGPGQMLAALVEARTR